MERRLITNIPSEGIYDPETGEHYSPQDIVEKHAAKGQYTDIQIGPATRHDDGYHNGELIPDMVAITGIPAK